jgi:hypothetical protein
MCLVTWLIVYVVRWFVDYVAVSTISQQQATSVCPVSVAAPQSQPVCESARLYCSLQPKEDKVRV